jgi:hypothetical protein
MLMLENLLPLLLLTKLVAVETGKSAVSIITGLFFSFSLCSQGTKQSKSKVRSVYLPRHASIFEFFHISYTDGDLVQYTYRILSLYSSSNVTLTCAWMMDALPRAQNDDVVNKMVPRLLSPTSHQPPAGVGLALHLSTCTAGALLYGPYQRRRREWHVDMSVIIWSVQEMQEAGIRFRKSITCSLHDIRFWHDVLSMPAVSIDDSTDECMLLNMMAFERLHIGAGNDVTAYVFFMGKIIDLGKDICGAADLYGHHRECCRKRQGGGKAVQPYLQELDASAGSD